MSAKAGWRDRACKWPGCGATFTPTGARQEYCPEHGKENRARLEKAKSERKSKAKAARKPARRPKPAPKPKARSHHKAKVGKARSLKGETRYVLLKDLTIPAGTVFGRAPGTTVHVQPAYDHVIGMGPDHVLYVTVPEDCIEAHREHFVRLRD